MKTLPTLTDGKGRIYIYRTESSTKSSLQYGYGIKKNTTFCSVGDTAYELMWEAFRYIDLPEGQYEVTCGNDILKKVDFWSSKGHFQKGVNRIQVSILSDSETFIKADAAKEKPFFQPILVKPEQGHKEMHSLPYQKNAIRIAGGKITM